MKMRKGISLCGTLVLLFANYNHGALAQSPSQTTLVVDLQNVVSYQYDIPDPTKSATNPNLTPSAGLTNFARATILGDIVAVNGQSYNGTYVSQVSGINAS